MITEQQASNSKDIIIDKEIVLAQLISKLDRAKASAREEGTISADELEKELEIY